MTTAFTLALIAFATATAVVLADNTLRLVSAFRRFYP